MLRAGIFALLALLAAGGLGRCEAAEGLVMLNRKSVVEFDSNSTWFNSPPLSMEGLRGKTVLVQFWTFSCINWLRTLPYLSHWHETYKDKGLVVIGVHSPEFAFENDASHVAAAIRRFGIAYSVVQDNQFNIWNAYGNRYWPAQYLIDSSGKLALTQFGEGNYRKMHLAIAELLGVDPADVHAEESDDPGLGDIGSSEMYFGSARNQRAVVSTQSVSAGTQSYTAPPDVTLNRFAFVGIWTLAGESATLAADAGEIILRFRAPKVNLVAGSQSAQTLSITVDGEPQPPVTIKESQLYVLYEGSPGEHVLRLTIPKAGLSAYTLTFG